MLNRRDVLQVGAAAAAVLGTAPFGKAVAQQKLTQAELLKFEEVGNVTLLHMADLHGQLVPVYFREPSVNIGVGEARGLPPHLTGANFLKRFGIQPKSAAAFSSSPG